MCDSCKNDKKNKGDEGMGAVKPIQPTRISANTKEEQRKFMQIANDCSEPNEYVKSVINQYRKGKNAKRTK